MLSRQENKSRINMLYEKENRIQIKEIDWDIYLFSDVCL